MRKLFRPAILAAALVSVLLGGSARADLVRHIILNGGAPSWVPPGAGLACNFAAGLCWQQGRGQGVPATFLATTRASATTNLLPSSPAGFPVTTFPSNAPAITAGRGLDSYQAVTNYLLNSGTPTTQTTGSLGAGTYTVWVNGAGSATPSAGTATGCTGFAAASQGSPDTFACTGGGTIVATVSGALNEFQLDNTPFGGPYCPTAGTTATCAATSVAAVYPMAFGTASTALMYFTPQAPTTSGSNQAAVRVSDGTLNNSIFIYRASGVGKFVASTSVAGTQTFAIGSVVSPGASIGVGWSVQSGSQILVENGGSAVTATGAWPPTAALNTINIGSSLGSGQLNGAIAGFAIWPAQALSTARLTACSALSAPGAC